MDWLAAPPTPASVAAVTSAFVAAYGGRPDGVWSAPGRVNLVGEHTDYNAGLCLPIALPHRTYVAARLRADGRWRMRSAQDESAWEGSLDDVGRGRPEGWAAYAVGVPWALARAGLPACGADVLVDGHVPLGAGLSSSAALECSVAMAVDALCGMGLAASDAGRDRLAAICVEAENVVAQAPTGGMDQRASLRCTAGRALLLDTRDGSTRQVPLHLETAGLAVLVLDTRAPHALVDGQYAARRRTCEEAARTLGVASLREVSPDRLDEALRRLGDDESRRRVRHVVTEIDRVERVVSLLDAGRVADLGPLLDASHTSLRDDYEVSCRELDVAVEAARAAGALGARMTGGGFGGSAIALVPTEAVGDVAAQVAAAYDREGLAAPAFLLATPSAGAQQETPPSPR